MKILLVDGKFVIDSDGKITDVTENINKLILKKWLDSKNDTFFIDNKKYYITLQEDKFIWRNIKLAKMVGLRVDTYVDRHIFWDTSALNSAKLNYKLNEVDLDITYEKMLKLPFFEQTVYKECIVDWRPHENWNQLIKIMKLDNTPLYDHDIVKQHDVVCLRLKL